MVERCVRDAEVASSNLVASILFLAVFWLNAGIAQSVEHFTRNEGVVSSSLISSSTQSLMSFRRKRDQAFFRAAIRAGKVNIELTMQASLHEKYIIPVRLTCMGSCGIMFVSAK